MARTPERHQYIAVIRWSCPIFTELLSPNSSRCNNHQNFRPRPTPILKVWHYAVLSARAKEDYKPENIGIAHEWTLMFGFGS
nr:hypothetical protein CFP56_44450 [Quercus suber]